MRRASAVLALLLAGCPSTGKPPPKAEPVAPVAPGPAEKPLPEKPLPEKPLPEKLSALDLGTHHRAISTTSPEAQLQFDRGLVYVYAFDHSNAIAAFQSATAADPECPMAWWGVALANGPHYNNLSVSEVRARAAWEAIEKARRLGAHATPVERSLVSALWRRYTKDVTVTERHGFDEAYAFAMRDVWTEHKDDPDVGTLFAESLMDLHPWDLWTADGKAKDDTDEIVATLKAVLALQPTNPGANHFFIHAIEGSANPHDADAAADRLRTLVPDASHLLHMPAHIDARVGRWAQASDTNARAVQADERAEARVARTGYFRLYMAHNRHFLAYSAMMEGRSKVALEAARGLVAHFPRELVEAYPRDIDGYLPIALHVLVRFGRWKEILEEPAPDEALLVSSAVWHYARGVALAALGKLDEADTEKTALDAIYARMDDRRMGKSTANAVLPIPMRTLAAEIAFRRGKTEDALALLREAVALQDGLGYDEPPGWMQPARHVLAATLLAAKQPVEAEKVLQEDLARLPENGWALVGLVKCFKARGAEKEAKDAEARLAKAWARADVKATSPCLCQPGD